MIILECDQNTPQWNEARLGLPTASRFKEIIHMDGTRSKSRTKYLYDLAGEKISGEKKKQKYYGSSMEKGHEREDESRQQYSFVNDVEVVQVGFCFFDEKKEFGCSPDGLVGEDGGLETKNAESYVQIDRLENGWPKGNHFHQIQGSLYVTGREWWDRISYSRGIQTIQTRYYRDEKFISVLANEIQEFIHDLNKLVNKWKN